MSNPNCSRQSSKIAVLGGCGGIGRELVSHACQLGHQLAVLDIEPSLNRHSPPDEVLSIAVDATHPASLKTAFSEIDQHWGALDGLVNLCGFMHDNAPATQIADPVWDDIIQGNFSSVLNTARAAMPLLEKGTMPSIVHASSGLAQFIRPGFGAYAAAKAGVIALTKTLALEHAPAVRVNAVAPAAVDTAFLRGGTGRSDEAGVTHIDIEAYTRAIPLQRIAVPGDIVGPIMFLLGADSAYMTGQVLWINGGAYMP